MRRGLHWLIGLAVVALSLAGLAMLVTFEYAYMPALSKVENTERRTMPA
jgi:cytochrome b subunit of formate dehydrogenase